MKGSLAPSPYHGIAVLQDLLERLQIAPNGSLAFDAAIVAAFGSLPAIGPSAADASRLHPGPHCSTVLGDVMGLLPANYNFALGPREGVRGGGIPPNAGWRPGEGESRHDHPGGSGLAIADTPVLAVACAAIRLHARLIEERQRCVLHRLIYVSRCTSADPRPDLQSIVACSRANNLQDGITGILLLLQGGALCQILEGPFAPLNGRFSRIRSDTRHADLRVLQAVPISRRRYPGWPLGFATGHHHLPLCEDPSALSAEAALDLALRLEYQQEHWSQADLCGALT